MDDRPMLLLSIALIATAFGIVQLASEDRPSVERIEYRITGGLLGADTTFVLYDGTAQLIDRRQNTTATTNVSRAQYSEIMDQVLTERFRSLPDTVQYDCRAGVVVTDIPAYELRVAYGNRTKQLTTTCGLGGETTAPQELKTVMEQLNELRNNLFQRGTP